MQSPGHWTYLHQVDAIVFTWNSVHQKGYDATGLIPGVTTCNRLTLADLAAHSRSEVPSAESWSAFLLYI